MTATENAVACIWAEALQIAGSIAPSANLGQWGADAPAMILAAHRINEAFGTRLHPVALADLPVLQEFCEFLNSVVILEEMTVQPFDAGSPAGATEQVRLERRVPHRPDGGVIDSNGTEDCATDDALVCILRRLRQAQVVLRLKGHDLLYTTPKDELSPQLLRLLGRHRLELIAFLRRVRELTSVNQSKPLMNPALDGAPLLPVQRTLASKYPGSSDPGSQHVGFCLRLSGDPDLRALRESVATLIQRHHVLHSRLAVDSNSELSLKRDSRLSAVPESVEVSGFRNPKNSINEVFSELLTVKFDLQSGPLLRTHVVKASRQDWVLIVTAHAIVADEWSLRLMLSEIQGHYAFLVHGWSSRIPEPPLQFADYVAWYEQRMSETPAQARVTGWPAALSSRSFKSTGGEPRRGTLSERSTAILRALSCRQRVTMQCMMLTAVAVAMRAVSGRDDSLVLVMETGRAIKEFRKVIGQLTGAWPLAVDLSGSPEFRCVLQSVREQYRSAQLHSPPRIHSMLAAPGSLVVDPSHLLVAVSHLRASWIDDIHEHSAPFRKEVADIRSGNLSSRLGLDLMAHILVIDSPRAISWAVRPESGSSDGNTIEKINNTLLHVLESLAADASVQLKCFATGTHS